jgi:uncharacterized protein YaaN involved in tellurite resistance
MSTTAEATPATPTLQFAVPGAPTAPPPLQIPQAVDKPIAAGLATVSKTPEERQGVVCKMMIPPDQQAKAQQDAATWLPQMLDSTPKLMTFGSDSLAGVNNLVNQLMKLVGTSDLGSLGQDMKQLTLNMQSIKGKYDVTQPNGKKAYDEWQHSLLKRLIHHGRNYIEAMRVDMMSVQSQLDKLEEDINQRKNTMIRNVTYLDQLYEENEKATYDLIYAIAVMEDIVDLARQQASQIPDDAPNSGNANSELKQKYADLIMQMDVKIGEYKGRLFVAWSTSPQVRMMRVLNVGMAEKLNEADGMTIPTMKLVMVQMAILVSTQNAEKAEQAVSDATNQMVQELATTSAAAAGVIMTAVQTPTLLPETVTVVTDSMTLMADNILQAIDAGNQSRANLENVIGASKQVLDGSSRHFDEAVISKIIDGSTSPRSSCTLVYGTSRRSARATTRGWGSSRRTKVPTSAATSTTTARTRPSRSNELRASVG